MKILTFLLIALGLVVLALLALRWNDRRAVAAAWARLEGLGSAATGQFDPAMVAELPEPARRYLTWAIRPGTPLVGAVEVGMAGQFGLGDKADPKYMPMRASQILAPPHGFVWEMRTSGVMRVSGSDTGAWTRFSLFDIVPVARIGGTEDHRRSAFGREVAEAAIWTPGALMPRDGVTWEAAGPDTARVTVRHEGLEQAVDLTLDADGAPVSFVLSRWSDANPGKVWQYQPFGGTLSDYREVDGYRIPFHNEAGNHFGTPDYFPFFIADLDRVAYLRAP
ncbi:MAG: DUF6544 family protein [Pseudooceanicola sp.]